MDTIMIVLVFVVCNAWGLSLLTKALKVRKQSQKAQLWPTTNALILECNVEEDPARNFAGSIKIESVIEVKYQYEVRGKTYEGDRVCFGRPVFSYVDASSVADQFKVGNKVPVYYDKENPSESVLAPKTDVGMPSYLPAIFLILVGLVVPIVSIIY